MSALSLPPELLEIIFQERVRQAHNRDGLSWQFHICDPHCVLGWIQVTHVCRRWRTVALGCPRLWSHPVITHRRWAEEMLVRSGRTRFSIAAYLDDDESDGWMKSVEHAKQLVVRVPPHLLIALINDINERGTSLGSGFGLESLSLAQSSISSPSMDDAPSLTHLVNAAALRRLHLGPSDVEFSTSIFDGMSNLHELSLESCIGRLSGLSGKQIHLPNLARLHLIDQVHECKNFLASLHHPKPLEYLGLRDDDNPLETAQLLIAAQEIISRHHALGQTKQHSSAALVDLNGHHCAVGIALSTLRTQAFRRIFRYDYNLAAWSTAEIHPAAIVALCNTGLFRDTPFSYPSPHTASALLDSSPALFIGGAWQRFEMYNRPSDILSGLTGSFSLRTVVCAVVADSFNGVAITREAMSALFLELQSIQYLEMSHADLDCFAGALTPAISTSEGDTQVPLPKLAELVLSSGSAVTVPEAHFASCFRARACRGSPLLKLRIRGRVAIASEGWAMLRELPIAITQESGR